jgi:hypothetical protein
MRVVSLLGVGSVLSCESVLGSVRDVTLARLRVCCVPVRVMTTWMMSA